MAITVKDFAKTLKISDKALLERMQKAGLKHSSESDEVTASDKQALLKFLKGAKTQSKSIKSESGVTVTSKGKSSSSTASKKSYSDNIELKEARRKKIPVIRRSEILAELMRLKSNIAIAGTHGKTTTTSMVAAVLESGMFDPTVVNGGIIQDYGSNARLGEGDWMIVEADESDGTLIEIPSTISIVTNLDPEHLDHYGTFTALKNTFLEFLNSKKVFFKAVNVP